MKDLINVGGFTASQSFQVSSFESTIRGEVYPFPNRFFSLKYKITISKRDRNDEVSIDHEVGFSGNSFSGAQAISYVKAANAALEQVQKFQCIAESLGSNPSDTVYAIVESLEYLDLDMLLTYITLTPSVKAGLSNKCNWNFRKKGPKDTCIFDAVVNDKSFDAAIEALEAGKAAKCDDSYHKLPSKTRSLINSGVYLAEKAGVMGMSNSDIIGNTLKLFKIVRNDVSVLNIKYDSLEDYQD